MWNGVSLKEEEMAEVMNFVKTLDAVQSLSAQVERKVEENRRLNQVRRWWWVRFGFFNSAFEKLQELSKATVRTKGKRNFFRRVTQTIPEVMETEARDSDENPENADGNDGEQAGGDTDGDKYEGRTLKRVRFFFNQALGFWLYDACISGIEFEVASSTRFFWQNS
jgi:hypothetical protein